jgi:predicted permease
MMLALTILPVFFTLALGYYAGLRGRVDNKDPHALIAVLMQFALPCSLFLGIGSAPPAVLRSEFPLLLLLAGVMLASYGLTYFLSRRFGGATLGEAAVLSLTVAFANNVAIGLPLLSRVAGPGGQLAGMCGIVAGALVVSPLTLVLLEIHAQQASGSTDPRGQRVLKAIGTSLRRPVILAPALGLLLPLTKHSMPALGTACLETLGKGTVGLALFLTGLILSAQPFRVSRGVVLCVLLKNFGQATLFVGVVYALHLHGPVAQQGFLLTCVPAGFFGTVFGARFRIASQEAGSTLVLSTLLGAATLPLAVFLATRLP